MKKINPKTIILIAVPLKILLDIVFIVWFFNVDAFWNYPFFLEFSFEIKQGDVVFYDELDDPPQYIIEERGRWFKDSFSPVTLRKLKNYMKKNNLCILPGKYDTNTCCRVDDLVELLNFDDASKYK